MNPSAPPPTLAAPTQPAARAGTPAPAASNAAASIVVLGGGPIGLVCALLLARQGIGCELVDARAVEALQRDRRLLALSRGTLLVLESLLGPGFAPMAPIERVFVSSRGEPGAARLAADDFDGVPLGATVWYADLVTALARAADAAAGVRVQRPRRAERIVQKADCVEVVLDDGTTLTAGLAVNAEGTPPRAPQPRYCAVLAELTLPGSAAGDAFERFTREGPLALLPLPPERTAGGGAATRLSMIWCLPADVAQARAQCPDGELLAQIAQALGPRIGAPTSIGPRSVFPLTTHRLDQVCEHRVVHLGNAAQSLHPVAGQGFNLGIRDCVCLVDCLVDSRLDSRLDSAVDGPRGPGKGRGDDPIGALALYRERRRLDRRLIPGLTGALPRVFSSTLAPIAAGRSAALAAIDALPGVRRAFARLLMFGVPR
jgi:2-octaprenyl-6-methoxyphenol hydroxylase